MLPIYLTKFISVASSTGIALLTSAAGQSITLNSSSLGTARRIVVWGSSSAKQTFRIAGLAEDGSRISETITGSSATGAAIATTQDFISVSSVTIVGTSGITSTNSYIGTNTTGGTMWQAIDTFRNPIELGFTIVPSTVATNTVSMETTQDYPAYNPTTALWGGFNTLTGPVPINSTAASSVTATTQGIISSMPFSAWRLTLTSSSSSAGGMTATVLQSG